MPGSRNDILASIHNLRPLFREYQSAKTGILGHESFKCEEVTVFIDPTSVEANLNSVIFIGCQDQLGQIVNIVSYSSLQAGGLYPQKQGGRKKNGV